MYNTNPNSTKVVVCSNDYVFTEVIKRIIEKVNKRCEYKILTSFSEASKISFDDTIDLIIVDDRIIGRSSYELISYLRLHQKIITPIFYFGVTEYGGEKKAFSAGTNRFFTKPFKPDQIESSLQEFLSTKEIA